MTFARPAATILVCLAAGGACGTPEPEPADGAMTLPVPDSVAPAIVPSASPPAAAVNEPPQRPQDSGKPVARTADSAKTPARTPGTPSSADSIIGWDSVIPIKPKGIPPPPN